MGDGAKGRGKTGKAPASRETAKKPRKRTQPERRRPGSKLREAIVAAIGQDRELMAEARGDAADDSEKTAPAQKRQDDRTPRSALAIAVDALEPVLSDAVRKHPSVLGRIAYGTAQLLTTLASEDRSSTKRLEEIAGTSHVGIVFVDVVGFTAFTAANGDDAAVELVTRLEALVASVVRRHDGEVVKHLGDGFLLAFPSAGHAIRAALALRDGAGKAREANPAFQPVRIAVHAGTPSVVGSDLIGHDVNLTARLLEYCEPGGVLVTEDAKKLSEKRLKTLRFADEKRIKPRGLPDAVMTYQVQGLRKEIVGAGRRR